MNSSRTEVEIKFYVQDIEKIKDILSGKNAQLIKPRYFEQNWRFDTEDKTMGRKHQILRLRQDTDSTLTFKGESSTSTSVLSRQEIETQVSDPESAQAILIALGYQLQAVYEKYRTVYELGEGLVYLDEMPYGNFLEIEASDACKIRSIAELLELDWNERIFLSYLNIFDRLVDKYNLELRDLTFANFSSLSIDESQLISFLYSPEEDTLSTRKDIKPKPINQMRNQKYQKDDKWVRDFLIKSQIAHIATRWEEQPFITSTTFWFDPDRNEIYFHSNITGRTRSNCERYPQVCLEVSRLGKFLSADTPLEFSLQYESAIVFGKVRVLENKEDKCRALYGLIQKYFPDKYSGSDYSPISDQELTRTSVYTITVESWSGKSHWKE